VNSHRNQQFLIVGTGFLVQAVYVGLLFMFGILFLEFEETFGWSRAVISGAFSGFLLATGCIGIAMGKLNDLFGPRRIMIIQFPHSYADKSGPKEKYRERARN
jgi:MFS family permease